MLYIPKNQLAYYGVSLFKATLLAVSMNFTLCTSAGRYFTFEAEVYAVKLSGMKICLAFDAG